MIRTAHHRIAGAALVAALAAAPALSATAPAQAADQDIVSVSPAVQDGHRQQILTEINAYRASRGLAPVAYSPTITGIAQDESDRVVRAEHVSHSMDFLTDPRRGSGVTAMHEITALEHSLDPKALVRWWKGSPSHNKVLLSPSIQVIGIGVTVTDGSLARTGQPWRIVSVVDGYGYRPGHGPSDARSSVTVTSAPRTPAPTAAPRPTAPTPSRPGPFVDVPASHLHAGSIGWAKGQGLLRGWSDGTYRPHQAIDRDAMAAVAYRMAGSPAHTPPATSPFTDVRPGQPFYREITWAHQQGLLTGWSDGTFRPQEDISREATAALMWRMAGRPAATGAPTFSDVSSGGQHSQAVSWLAAQGITEGYRDGSFRPTDTTRRDAMAAFLHRYSG